MPTQAQFDSTLQNHREIDIKVTVLDFEMFELDEISGLIINSDISIDGDSDIRRTANITMQLSTPYTNTEARLADIYWRSGNEYWYDKYLQIEVAIRSVFTGEYEWVNQGIYLIDAPSTSYDATNNQLTFQAVDLMSKMTGMRNGYLEGVAYEVPVGSIITDVIEETLNEAGFTKHILLTPPVEEVPYDIKIDVGSTVYDLLKELRDINVNWEMFFNEEGVFIFQQIPSGKVIVDPSTGEEGEPSPLVNDEIWQQLKTSEDISTNFEDVKNYIQVLGKTLEPNYWGNAISNGNSITITDETLDTSLQEGEYDWLIGTNVYTDGTITTNLEQGSINLTTGENLNTDDALIGAVRNTVMIPIVHNTSYIIRYTMKTRKYCYPRAYYYDDSGSFISYSPNNLGNFNSDPFITFTTPNNSAITHVRFVFSGSAIDPTGSPDYPLDNGWILQSQVQIQTTGDNVPLDTTADQLGKLQVPITQVTFIGKDITLADVEIVGIDDKPNSIKYVNEAYVFNLRRDEEGNYKLYYYGYIQPQAIAWEDNPDSPFYVGDIISGYRTIAHNTTANILVDVFDIIGAVNAKPNPSLEGYMVVDLTNILPLSSISEADVGSQWKIRIDFDESFQAPITDVGIHNLTMSLKDSNGKQTSFDFSNQSYLLTIDKIGTGASDTIYRWDYLPIKANNLTTPTDEYIDFETEFALSRKVRFVCTGDEYDNIFTNDLAIDRAKYEVYLRARLHDNLTINTVPIYWLNVNEIIEYTPENQIDETPVYWLVKSINTSLSATGTQTITAIRYYPLYPSI